MVKLITHNFLSSNVRGVKNPYPLRIQVTEASEIGMPLFSCPSHACMCPRWSTRRPTLTPS